MQVEYVLTCSCGKGQRLELTEREQYDGDLNKSTQIIANLFEYFHAQHGTVEGGFALKDNTRDLGSRVQRI
jgi:hypothetical protein